MAERRDLVRGVSGRYRRSSKKEKGRILDEFVKMTGYNRIYAVWLLNQQGRKVRVNRRLVVVVGEAGIGRVRRHAGYQRYDTEAELELLSELYEQLRLRPQAKR